MPRRQGKQPSDREKEAAKAASSASPENEVGNRKYNEVGTRQINLLGADKRRSHETREVRGPVCY